MSGFSPEWLALREAADHRARSEPLARLLARRTANRPDMTVIDLGSGTGSNLRAIAEFLPVRQHWTLVDHDTRLIEAAKDELALWADSAEATASGLLLKKSGRRIAVSFLSADLANELESVLGASPDLVTASALFDLVSLAFIERFAVAVSSRKAVFYTTLTYNGVQRWVPPMPVDDAMIAAFNKHQTTDKGFGPSAGPAAAVLLAEQFRAHGYAVEEGDSPWDLGASDSFLIDQLADGIAAAVAETAAVSTAAIAEWVRSPRTSVVIGHTDTLAVPA